MTTHTVELLELLVLEVNDLKSSVVVELVNVQALQDSQAGYTHMMLAGIGMVVMLLTWLAVWSTRR